MSCRFGAAARKTLAQFYPRSRCPPSHNIHPNVGRNYEHTAVIELVFSGLRPYDRSLSWMWHQIWWMPPWNTGCVSVSSPGCHSVMSLVTIDLDSELGRPQSYRQASDNHVIHHSGVESNAQVRNLKLAVNPHPHVGRKCMHAHVHTRTREKLAEWSFIPQRIRWNVHFCQRLMMYGAL